jgi:hypothetical protein
VRLLLVYVALMFLGGALDYFVGLAVERLWGSTVSLIAFLALYFLFLWLAWVISVWLTAPRATRPAAP